MIFGRVGISAAVAAALGGIALNAQAAEWSGTAGVSPGVLYTDNVCLSPDDEKQDEVIGLLTPDFAVRAEGAKANLDIAGAVQLHTLSNSRLEELGCLRQSEAVNRSNVLPRLRATADAELVEQWLFIDAKAFVRQNRVNPFRATGVDGLDRTGNLNTTTQWSISPYLAHTFKDEAAVYLRYLHDEQYNTDDTIGDSTRDAVQALVGNNPGTTTVSRNPFTQRAFTWGLQADYDRIDFRRSQLFEPAENELASIRFTVAYRFNSAFSLDATIGEEENDFFSTAEEIDGELWDIGLRWTPNSRTVVTAGYGERFFGETPRLDVQYEHKRSALSISYSRDLTYARQIRGDGPILVNTDELGNPVDPGTGDLLEVNGEETTRTTSPILNERFAAAYIYSGRRSTFRIDAIHSDQTRAEDERDATFMRAGITFDRSLARNFSLNTGITWFERKADEQRDGDVINSETARFFLGLNRAINSNTDLTLRYDFIDRDSERETDTYKENRITLSFVIRV